MTSILIAVSFSSNIFLRRIPKALHLARQMDALYAVLENTPPELPSTCIH
ncbi:MAG: hypothetical protein PVG32_08325 [Anaerolineales bacterium]|jgi:hypothetical protein